MNRRTALGLAALGSASLACALLLGRSDTAPPEGGGLVFEGLAASLPQAARVEIASGGKSVVLLRRAETGAEAWGVAERDAYPAQLPKLRELLTGLAELRLSAPRTQDPAQFARLGVEEPAAANNATALRVLDKEGRVLANLITGHRRSLTRGNVAEQIYIRRPGENRVWLADGRLAPEADPLSWLVRDLLDIKRDKLAAIRVTRGETSLALARKDGTLTLTTPADRAADAVKLEQLGSALESLTLNDVRKGAAPGAPSGQAVFETTDGLTLTFLVSKDDKALWTTIQASGTGAEAYARLAGWAFNLPDWRESALLPQLSDLLPPPATSSAEPPAPGPQE